MQLLPQLPKSTVCLQCGDRGFPEILVACATCRLYAVHRYCLHKLPTNFTDPVTWFCEDCRPGDYALLSAPRMAVTRETVDDMSEEVLSSEGKQKTGDQAEKRLPIVPYTGGRPEKTLVPKREVPEKMLAQHHKETTEEQSENRLVKMLVPKREETAGDGSEKMLVPKPEEAAGDRSEKMLVLKWENTAGDQSEKMLAPKREDTTGDQSERMLAPKQEDTTGERSEKRLAILLCTGDQKAVTQETTDGCSDKKLDAEEKAEHGKREAGDLFEKKPALVSAASSQPEDAVTRGGTRETVTNDDDALPGKKTVIQETAGNDNNVLSSRKTVTRETTDYRSSKKPILKREATTDGRSGKKLPLAPRPTAASVPEKKTVIQETAGNDNNVLPSRKTFTRETTNDRSDKKPIPEREATTLGRSGKKLPLVPRPTAASLPEKKTVIQETAANDKNVLPSRKKFTLETTDDRSNKKSIPEREATMDGRSGKKLPLVPRPTVASLPVVDDALGSCKRFTQETTTKYKDDISNKDAVSIGRKRLRPETTLLAQKAATLETTDDRSNKKPTPQREGTTGGRSEKMLALVPEATAVCRPLEDAVWRGSLNIMNKGPGGALVGGFHLFLSDTACDRVRAEAEALAPAWSIRLEVVPRLGLWPESFGKLGPARSEVGLFLLANAGEGDGEGLVREMVKQDLAMRGAAWRTEEAELLVFTSAVLPADLWMIDGKFYLWGVFRGKMKESTMAAVREATTSCLLRPTPSGRDDWIGIPFPLR